MMTLTTSYICDPDRLFLWCTDCKDTMRCINCVIPGPQEIALLCEHEYLLDVIPSLTENIKITAYVGLKSILRK